MYFLFLNKPTLNCSKCAISDEYHYFPIFWWHMVIVIIMGGYQTLVNGIELVEMPAMLFLHSTASAFQVANPHPLIWSRIYI